VIAPSAPSTCAAPNQFPTICILISANFDERSWGEPAATPSRELGGELPLLVVLNPLMNGRFAPEPAGRKFCLGEPDCSVVVNDGYPVRAAPLPYGELPLLKRDEPIAQAPLANI
jgi:hypothetical protein